MRRLLAAGAVVLALYLLLASQSGGAFGKLIYDESKLVPPTSEPKVVESIVGNRSGGVLPVVLEGPGLEAKAKRLVELFPSATTPWTILDRATSAYWQAVNRAVDNATAEFRRAASAVANRTAAACASLGNLTSAYLRAVEGARRLLAATYGVAALGRATDNDTGRFFAEYRRLVAEGLDVDAAVREAASRVYGINASLLEGVSWGNWSTSAAVARVAARAMGINDTLARIAAEAAGMGVERYVALLAYPQTPPPLRPYLHMLLCKQDVEAAVELFRRELVENITRQHPPPTLNSLNLSLVRGRYAIALLNSTSEYPEVPASIGVPVSSSFLLRSFQRTVTEDVSTIDRATALALFAVLLAVMGALAAPLVIVGIVGLTYLAFLGLLYIASDVLKPYYLVAYTAAPVMFALGVDYSLLMVSRYAEERGRGLDRRAAVAVVRRYANRAIASSIAVVAVSLGSFAASSLPFMQSLGIGYLLAAAFIAASVFLLIPAAIAVLGDRILWPRRAFSHGGRSALMERAVSTALRRPAAVAAAAAAATLAAFLYVHATLNITANPVVTLPENEYRRALEVATAHFSDVISLSTTYVVSQAPLPPSFYEEVKALPHFVSYSVEERGGWHVVSIKFSLESTSDQLLYIYNELDKLRQKYGDFLIGGAASWKYIVFHEIYDRFWSFQVYIIVGAVAAILALLLRSFLIPIRLIATVLMSVAWSMALEVAAFQQATSTPTYWLLPIILFAFLMAIGTDYDIFIVSRIREEMEGGKDEREAIRAAIVTTGPVVTGAAMILAAAFSTLMLSQTSLLREVGLTVAAAALMDAFLIRPFVVPALMVLAGRYNWAWIPPLRRR